MVANNLYCKIALFWLNSSLSVVGLYVAAEHCMLGELLVPAMTKQYYPYQQSQNNINHINYDPTILPISAITKQYNPYQK